MASACRWAITASRRQAAPMAGPGRPEDERLLGPLKPGGVLCASNKGEYSQLHNEINPIVILVDVEQLNYVLVPESCVARRRRRRRCVIVIVGVGVGVDVVVADSAASPRPRPISNSILFGWFEVAAASLPVQ
jgi:hypothetical protein